MHEIIYLQLGNLPNYIGTHFWNAQDAYTEEEVDHNVSWSSVETGRRGINSTALRPRVLIFDRKNNFGTLHDITGEDQTNDDPELDVLRSWDGPTQEVAEAPMQPSRYISRLGEAKENAEDGTEEENSRAPKPQEVRFWSDYNHVYFASSSIRSIPATNSSSGDASLSWLDGAELFVQYDKAEDCDSLQGFQNLSHSSSFGGFYATLQQQIVDEYPKSNRLHFSILDDYTKIWDAKGATPISDTNLISNVMTLYQAQLSDLFVPLLPQVMWEKGGWKEGVIGFENSYYHTSALYGAHIESVTLPLRQNNRTRAFESLVSALNGNAKTPIVSLEGIFPLQDEAISFEKCLQLSLPGGRKSSSLDEYLVTYDIIRCLEGHLPSPLPGPGGRERRQYVTSNLYPIPTSHPQFFALGNSSTDTSRHITETGVYSSLGVRNRTEEMLTRYADWSDRFLRLGGDIRGTGLDADEWKEMIEGIRAAKESYGVGEAEAEGGAGQDEEI